MAGMIVLDDYEGELANAPAMAILRQLTEVRVLDRAITSNDYPILKNVQILLALRERTTLDERFLDACPNLELILQTGGHAYHIDRAAASRKGIVIALGRRVSAPAVAIPELVFALLLGLIRQMHPLMAEMRNGAWPSLIGGCLSGRTLGILGYGRLGRPVARLAEAFDMKVVAWDRTETSAPKDSFGVERMPLDDLLAISDVLSIHLRLSEESRDLLNRERLRKMKPGAILINTARGAIVNEPALIETLREGRLAGAGLDVFAVEPLPPTSELRTLPNVILTPHVGWKTKEVLHEFVQIAADQLAAWLHKALPRDEVLNPEAIQVARHRNGSLAAPG